MQPENCQRVVSVKSASTVLAVETNCQPNQIKGRSHSHLGCGKAHFFVKTNPIPIKINGKKIQLTQWGGQVSFQRSASDSGGEILLSRMTGLPNFQIARPRKSPKASA